MNPFGKLLAISRRKSPWIFHAAAGSCNGCDIEIAPCITPRYDAEQIGVLLQGTPKHADILLVTGAHTRRLREAIMDMYMEMPSPKAVVAIGSCPASGNVYYGSPALVGDTIGDVIPVDVWVPGCPPRPQLIIDGIAQAARLLEEGRTADQQRRKK